ncbi:MAG: response regulator [Gammaproteobacteria bacterium]|nr:response regulator [Gammaproteobacteria bacterium]
MSKGTIVIVEDDDDQRSNYEKLLTRRLYTVNAFATKAEALEHLAFHRPDLLILDIILGDDYNGGFDVYNQAVRMHDKLPVLFLTDLDGEVDKVVGLRMGAWDYQSKPISMDYLAAKVEILMMLSHNISRNQRAPAPELIRGELTLNMASRSVAWLGQPIDNLTVTEFNMLYALVLHPGNVVEYGRFAEVTHSSVIEKNTISAHIKNLKNKIKKVAPEFDKIGSEYGLGYRWKA